MGKPAALKYATRTLTHGIPLTRNTNAGLSMGTGTSMGINMKHLWVYPHAGTPTGTMVLVEGK